ncbi:MAG: AAA family ATPase [Deltaproteobacteria bacterium]|nr:AAA family ATPase [Deltaproteobacteria bacterium]
MRIISPPLFVGREEELALLEKKYHSSSAEMIVVVGRRRIGKSVLIEKFCNEKNSLQFEGLEGEQTKSQIKYFTATLQKQLKDPILESVNFDSWIAAFDYLTAKIPVRGEKMVLVFDELQWMAAGQGKLVSLIKSYWDKEWKKKKLLLILCGSIASFMVHQVIRSKALYGRITGEIHLKGLSPHESIGMFKNKRGLGEILQYLFVFGGVPKYLEMIDLKKSFGQNMNELCFHSHALLLTEFEKIFFSQFKTYQTYIRIVKSLKDKMFSLDELSKNLKTSSGGGLLRYIHQLEEAEFIRSYISFDQNQNTKFKKYRLFDEFLLFYFKYMSPHLRTIKESSSSRIFELLTKDSWEVWCGLAFERFCIKHAHPIARVLGFSDAVLQVAPYFGRGDRQFQIDMIYSRADQVITVCEIKYNREPIGTKIIAEVERKTKLLKIPRAYTLEKVLICVNDATDAVKESEYFHHILPIQEIFSRLPH